jgi:diguanylate cyclase (GGDEF)-like protein
LTEDRTGILRNAVEYIDRVPKPVVLAVCLGVTGALGAVDFLAGPEVALEIYYLVPIGVATWFVGFRQALVVILLSAVTSYYSGRRFAILFPGEWVPYWNTAVEAAYFLVFSWLFSTIHRLMGRLEGFASIDHLTGIANGRIFREALDLQLQKCRTAGARLTVGYLDLDNFKMVNDRFGHRTGDEMLGRVAAAIQDQLRPGDLAARLGGDEFGILLPRTNRHEGEAIIKRVHDRVAGLLKNDDVPIGCSTGMVTCDGREPDAEALLQKADLLMYEAKRLGKHRIQVEEKPVGD